MDDIIIPQQLSLDNFKIIAPGPVGSVGSISMTPRLRTSNAAMFPVRYDKRFAGAAKGSWVSDGYTLEGAGWPARVSDEKWAYGSSTSTDIGDVFQDVRPSWRSTEPFQIGPGLNNFQNQVAQVNRAKATGNKFLPLPGAYAPDSLVRGGLIPSIVGFGALEPPAEAAKTTSGAIKIGTPITVTPVNPPPGKPPGKRPGGGGAPPGNGSGTWKQVCPENCEYHDGKYYGPGCGYFYKPYGGTCYSVRSGGGKNQPSPSGSNGEMQSAGKCGAGRICSFKKR